jgi:hypothetical protein
MAAVLRTLLVLRSMQQAKHTPASGEILTAIVLRQVGKKRRFLAWFLGLKLALK